MLEDEWASSRIVGEKHSCLVDLPLTQVLGGRFLSIAAWYDNEMAYATRPRRDGFGNRGLTHDPDNCALDLHKEVYTMAISIITDQVLNCSGLACPMPILRPEGLSRECRSEQVSN